MTENSFRLPEVTMDDMYRELIIEHYKNPSYRGELDPCDHAYEDENPSCGDELRIMLNVDENNIITDARFQGHAGKGPHRSR